MPSANVNACVNVLREAEEEISVTSTEEIFRLHYKRTAKLIGGVIRDPGRAEELAVEVFLKWPSRGIDDPAKASAWIRRTAIRVAVDELRRRNRKDRIDRAISFLRRPKTPEECYSDMDQQSQVARVLGALKRRDAELLLLQAEGLRYEELSAALGLNPKSVGKTLSRAQNHFRKEYEKAYGKPE
jgi:RNA polymerase sigma factor (sigma-70 family)